MCAVARIVWTLVRPADLARAATSASISGWMSVASTAPGRAHRAREAHREVAGAGADVGDGHAGRDAEQRDDAVGLLARVALGAIEPGRAAAGRRDGAAAVGAGLVAGRRRAAGGDQRDGQESHQTSCSERAHHIAV